MDSKIQYICPPGKKKPKNEQTKNTKKQPYSKDKAIKTYRQVSYDFTVFAQGSG